MSTFQFELFIAGQTVRSKRAVQELTELCESFMPGEYSLSIIDVLEHPERADEAKVLATPTLIRKQPAPVKRLIGDLSDQNTLVSALGLYREQGKNH